MELPRRICAIRENYWNADFGTGGSLIFDRVSEIASHYQYLGKVRSRRSLTPLPVRARERGLLKFSATDYG